MQSENNVNQKDKELFSHLGGGEWGKGVENLPNEAVACINCVFCFLYSDVLSQESLLTLEGLPLLELANS